MATAPPWGVPIAFVTPLLWVHATQLVAGVWGPMYARGRPLKMMPFMFMALFVSGMERSSANANF